MSLFEVPCPVCGADDEHEAWRAARRRVSGWMYGATFCPHPREPGHGTGCCCGGRSSRLSAPLSATGPAGKPPLTRAQVRALLSECVTVVAPGEVLVLRCPEGWTPGQVAEMQQEVGEWVAGNAPSIRVLIVPHLAVVQPDAAPASYRKDDSTASERADPELAWLESPEARQHEGHWVALSPETGEFLGMADSDTDFRRWQLRGATVVFVEPPGYKAGV